MTSVEWKFGKIRHHPAYKFSCVCVCLCLQKHVNSSLNQNVNNCWVMFHPLSFTTSVLI